MPGMTLLQKIKINIRLSSTAFDEAEIEPLIAAAKTDLKLAGILESKLNDDEDPLIFEAVRCYCKARFGYDNKDADRFQKAYDLLKTSLALSIEYTVEVEGDSDV